METVAYLSWVFIFNQSASLWEISHLEGFFSRSKLLKDKGKKINTDLFLREILSNANSTNFEEFLDFFYRKFCTGSYSSVSQSFYSRYIFLKKKIFAVHLRLKTRHKFINYFTISRYTWGEYYDTLLKKKNCPISIGSDGCLNWSYCSPILLSYWSCSTPLVYMLIC